MDRRQEYFGSAIWAGWLGWAVDGFEIWQSMSFFYYLNLWFSYLKFVEGFQQFWMWFVAVDSPLVVLGLVMGLLWIFGWVCFELCFGLWRMRRLWWWLLVGSYYLATTH